MSNEPEIHARASDPDTSFEAVPDNISEQAMKVLASYYHHRKPMLDWVAYALAHMGERRLANQRCSDLRRYGFIERCGRGVTPSGNSGYLCRITQAGIDYYEAHRGS